MQKRGQGWGVDLIIGGLIVLVGIIAFYGYTFNIDTEKNTVIKHLEAEGELIAAQLLDEGNPSDWTPSQVINVGILTQGKINQTKLEYLYTMTQANYPSMKQKFRITSEFLINMSEPLMIQGTPITGIGRAPQNATNIMKVSHISIYNNKPVTVWIITWK